MNVDLDLDCVDYTRTTLAYTVLLLDIQA